MYITEVLTKTTTGKVAHCCILLRESYREDGTVKTRTLANLTHCPPDDLAALRWALQHKQAFLSPTDSVRLVERLANDTLNAEDRALLGHLVQVLHTAPARQRAPRPRWAVRPARRRREP
jgi:hypothetical protein